jgi:hypothetical protein
MHVERGTAFAVVSVSALKYLNEELNHRDAALSTTLTPRNFKEMPQNLSFTNVG